MKRFRFIAIIFIVFISISIAAISCISSKSQINKSSLPSVTVPYAFNNTMQAGISGAPPVEVFLDKDLPPIIDKLTVYQIVNLNIDEKYAGNIANNLGFTNEWPLYGDKRVAYSYTKDDQTLEINLDGYIRLTQDTKVKGSPPTLPADQDCIDIAKDWLTSLKLYPSNVTRVSVGLGGMSVATVNTETGKSSQPIYYSKEVSFIPSIDGYECYALGAWVFVGDQGKIVGADINAPQYNEYGIVNLKTPVEAFNIIKNYLSSPLAVPPEAKECMTNYRAFDRLNIKDVSIRYFKSNSGYIQPIYVFEGDASYNNSSVVEKFSGEVDAVDHQNP